MPYIIQEKRIDIANRLAEGETPVLEVSGELNYAITRVCLQYIKDHELSYKVINDIVGVLECAKLEFYRRVAVPYENSKLSENGDVYDK